MKFLDSACISLAAAEWEIVHRGMRVITNSLLGYAKGHACGRAGK